MNNKFDELAKGLAQTVTRRGALKRFGFGLAAIALASLGLANKAEAARKPKPPCDCHNPPTYGCDPRDLFCLGYCGNNYCVGKGHGR